MVGAVPRMRALRGRLALVRNGLGAAVMPPEVKRLALTYSAKFNDGHMGPRKFWRVFLPRLKYHNPDVQMDVTRRSTIGGPATLEIEFASDKKAVIDCQHKHENEIVKALIDLTRAKQIPINERDSVLANEHLLEEARLFRAKAAKMAKRAAKKEEERIASGVVSTA
ncbi:hypothetical protein FN846DRAFT_951117 [Sphaerosporella brunnea]|uniref:Ribosomal protein/NADH dehydrogenase domain-containing protein n=1 Tax=Sphaerosporella brunnea TaxID=1250544 RepID=A0A5J5EW57_9PEZI|nr:hypothetical protein FN846DRAFT_951117 [Sphaerosporella brunnea]